MSDMFNDIGSAYGFWLLAVVVAFFVTLAFDKLVPAFKMLFWFGLVALVAFVVMRIGIQGLWEFFTRLDELGRKAVSE